MKITYIKLFKNKEKRENEKVLMKHLRDNQNHENKNYINDFREKFERVKEKGVNYEKYNKAKHSTTANLFENFFAKLNENHYNKFSENGKNIFNSKNLQKNQASLVAIALMLVTAGYLNYTNNLKLKMAAIGDAQLVSTNIIENEANDVNEDKVLQSNAENANNEIVETSIQEENKNLDNIENNEESTTVQTSTKENNENAKETEKNSDDYFTKTKMERDKMYSQMLETYQKIMENEKIPSDQKSIASNEIKNINNKKNSISTIESLLKGKDFNDMVVLINDNSIDIVIKKNENITPEQAAQIENIIARELNANIEDIHITTHN